MLLFFPFRYTMSPRAQTKPVSLEHQCLIAFVRYLYDEISLISHIKTYESKSVLLNQFGVSSDKLLMILERKISYSMPPILKEIVLQRIVDVIIRYMHVIAHELKDIQSNSSPSPEPFGKFNLKT